MAERRYRHPQVNLRMPEELKIRLSALADKNKRSGNAEMIAAIEAWVESAEKNTSGQFIAWGEEFLPEGSTDTVIMSEKQLSRIVNIATEEAINSAIKTLSEKFNFVPKGGKKTPHTD